MNIKYVYCLDTIDTHTHINTLAASPLASSGFAAIGCFRALPYDGIYIIKNYSKLTAKNISNLECKIEFFLFPEKT